MMSRYLCFLFLVGVLQLSLGAERPKNLLVITVDDMSADSLGCFGSKLAETSPRTDRLAGESLKFAHAHVCVANCYPSRNVMFSGLYPHNNQVEGFYPIQNKYPTLCDMLKKKGYYTGIRGKVTHTTPYHPYPGWDDDLTVAPDGSKYHIKDVPSYGLSTATGIARAKSLKKPFYLNVNISDPHKPFWNEKDQKQAARSASKIFKSSEVPIPGFLFDHPKVREELALYYTSVRRADDAVGSILDALRESGEEENTIVVFLSDHGMPLPFAKTALWHHSTHTPLLIKVPGTTKAGSLDSDHMVSAVDFVPTFLDLLKIAHPAKFDGRSFAPAIRGEKQESFESVFKVYNENSGAGRNPMRAIQTKDYLYLWNPWSDGTLKFKTATTGTASYRTMKEMAASSPEIAKRLKLFDHGTIHELYHIPSDPDCLKNLMDSDEHAVALADLQKRLEARMKATGDHALKAFQNRADASAGHAYTAQKQAEASERRASRRKGGGNRNKQGGKNQGGQKKVKLISLVPPKVAKAGEEVTLIVNHQLPGALKSQQLHVTLKGGRNAKRITRKVVSIEGRGSVKVTFDLPAEVTDGVISFAAFVGPEYTKNLHHVTSGAMKVED